MSQTNPIKVPHIIVLGNEKGGTGKSTLALHIIVFLLKQGYKVGSIDVDARQGTLTRYLENREINFKDKNSDLLLSQHISVHRSMLNDQEQNKDIDHKT